MLDTICCYLFGPRYWLVTGLGLESGSLYFGGSPYFGGWYNEDKIIAYHIKDSIRQILLRRIQDIREDRGIINWNKVSFKAVYFEPFGIFGNYVYKL